MKTSFSKRKLIETKIKHDCVYYTLTCVFFKVNKTQYYVTIFTKNLVTTFNS